MTVEHCTARAVIALEAARAAIDAHDLVAADAHVDVARCFAAIARSLLINRATRAERI